MPRRKKPRVLNFKPNVFYFKPRGIPLRILKEETLHPDEIEAVKLHDVDGFEQVEAAKKMKISQPTFARILDSAYKKIAKALIFGHALRIEENRV